MRPAFIFATLCVFVAIVAHSQGMDHIYGVPGLAIAVAQEVDRPRGFNIALVALGGKVERATSQYNEQWAAANVIDGVFFQRHLEGDRWVCTPPCGWSSAEGSSFPQEFVFSFYQGREALVAAMVIDPTTVGTVKNPDRIPKDVEVWASTTSPTSGFTKLADARLDHHPTEHVITFPPTRAKYVQLRILSNYGDRYTQIGEVKILEASDQAPSILADFPKNLALPVLGGTVVWFTSQASKDDGVHRLIEGGSDTRGWRSKDNYLPQEMVFAFRGDQVPLLQQLVVNPETQHDRATWAKLIAVAVSMESPLDGFEDLGQLTLTQDLQGRTFIINRRARFVKLRILENFGGRYTSLGKVKILEGSAVRYTSIVQETPGATASWRGTPPPPPVHEPGVIVETEPNDTPATATPLILGQRTKGTIHPLGEKDYFKLSLPGQGQSVLTLDVMGWPNIRTSLTLLDPTGQRHRLFDPGRFPTTQKTFSIAVNAGEALLEVTEPPITLVVVWDTSRSMADSIADLQTAVEAYLSHVQPSERVNLIRFAGQVEVLLPEFTNDRERLQAAAQGKFNLMGGTALYDAIAQGIKLLEGIQGNRAILVMTDGVDGASRLSHADFWQLLARKRIRLYPIGLGVDLQPYQPQIASSGARFLAHVALATNGRFFFAYTSDELRDFYQQIADELRRPSTYYVRPTLSQGLGWLSVTSTGERIPRWTAPQIELILDASGSMKEQKKKVNGRLKIDVAKEVMAQIIGDLPDDIQVALRLYGHRIREGQRGDCQDSELVFPFAKIDKPRLLQQVRETKALGTTPLAYSLAQARSDFGNSPGEKLIVLVTDGKEECRGNPLEVVAQLKRTGFDVKVNVVGFALADEATKQDMRRVAEITGGRFFDAQDQAGLYTALAQALALSYDVLDTLGTRVASGQAGQAALHVPEGIYTIAVRAAGKPITVPDVRIAPDLFTRVALKKEGQEIGTGSLGPLKPEAVKELLLRSGAEALRQRQYAAALGYYSEVIALGDSSPQSYLNRGLSHSALGAPAQAIRDYTRAIALDAKYALAYHSRGWSYGALREYKQAIRDLTQAIDLGLEPVLTARAYFRRGWSHGELGQYQQAIRDYDRAIALNEKDAVAYHNRGWSYVKLGKQQQAIKDYERAAQLGYEPAQQYLQSRGMRW